MFVDARSVDSGQVFASDICVVGAGAAGITLATPLAAAGFRVDLLESGGLEADPEIWVMTKARVAGREGTFGTLRLRYFGGTTNHWGGWCRPFEDFDFAPHPWIPDSGWPIDRADLDPYYDRARKILGIRRSDFRFDPSEYGQPGDPSLLGDDCADLEPVIWRLTQPSPTRMGGGRFRTKIKNSHMIRCVQHANATELLPYESGRGVRILNAATQGGRKLQFTARRYVLCTGTIENARLLLLSDSVIAGGLGNQNDLVGRYLGDHGYQWLGSLLIPSTRTPRIYQEERYLQARPKRGRADGVGFAATPEFRTKNRTLGFSMLMFSRMGPDGPGAPDSAPAVNDLVSVDGSTSGASKEASPMRDLRLLVVPEQSPNRESRVRLHRDRDALGLRRVELDLRTQKVDLHSRRESAKLFGLAVARAGTGRLHTNMLDSTDWSYGGNGHPAGTTRMADDPKKGVTDRNGRVHGVENLYVAGGSLYPTMGSQHPTLTIIALTLRLADHRKRTVERA